MQTTARDDELKDKVSAEFGHLAVKSIVTKIENQLGRVSVRFDRQKKRFHARVYREGVYIHIGFYKTEQTAQREAGLYLQSLGLVKYTPEWYRAESKRQMAEFPEKYRKNA